MEDTFSTMRPLFEGYTPTIKKSRKTERGELLKELSEGTKMPIGRIAFLVKGLELPDLYYLTSDCRQAQAAGIPYGAVFWTDIKAR